MRRVVRLSNFRGRLHSTAAAPQLNVLIQERAGEAAICNDTGLTYASKYDCALLDGATVLDENTGWGLRVPNCDLTKAAQFTTDDVAAIKSVIQDVRGEGDMIFRVEVLLVGKREDAPHILYYGFDGCDVVRRELCSLGEVTIRYS